MINYKQELIQINFILEVLIEFNKIYDYQDDLKKVISEGVFLAIILLELEEEMNSSLYVKSLEMMEMKRNLEFSVKDYIKDGISFVQAHAINK